MWKTNDSVHSEEGQTRQHGEPGEMIGQFGQQLLANKQFQQELFSLLQSQGKGAKPNSKANLPQTEQQQQQQTQQQQPRDSPAAFFMQMIQQKQAREEDPARRELHSKGTQFVHLLELHPSFNQIQRIVGAAEGDAEVQEMMYQELQEYFQRLQRKAAPHSHTSWEREISQPSSSSRSSSAVAASARSEPAAECTPCDLNLLRHFLMDFWMKRLHSKPGNLEQPTGKHADSSSKPSVSSQAGAALLAAAADAEKRIRQVAELCSGELSGATLQVSDGKIVGVVKALSQPRDPWPLPSYKGDCEQLQCSSAAKQPIPTTFAHDEMRSHANNDATLAVLSGLFAAPFFGLDVFLVDGRIYKIARANAVAFFIDSTFNLRRATCTDVVVVLETAPHCALFALSLCVSTSQLCRMKLSRVPPLLRFMIRLSRLLSWICVLSPAPASAPGGWPTRSVWSTIRTGLSSVQSLRTSCPAIDSHANVSLTEVT